jgi:hypothetical protein
MVDAAFAADDELVDVCRGFSIMRIGWTRIALLVATQPDAAAARATDVAGGQRDVHERLIYPVIVIAPDEALRVSDHGPPSVAALLRLRDPGRRLADVIDWQSGDPRRLLEGGLVRGHCGLEARGAGRDG